MELNGEIETTGDKDEIKECLSNILEIDRQIKELRTSRAEWIDQLINEDAKFRFSSPELNCFFAKGKKFIPDNQMIFDFLGIDPDRSKYLSADFLFQQLALYL